MAGIIIAPSISVLTVNYIGITNLMFKEYFRSGRREFYINRIIYTLITAMISLAAWYSCRLVPYEGVPGLIVRILVCSLVLILMVPSMMYLFKRDYLKGSIAFFRQILLAK